MNFFEQPDNLKLRCQAVVGGLWFQICSYPDSYIVLQS